MNLCDNSALELNRMLRGKQVSAVEIAQACLARIRAVDGRSGALDAAAVSPAPPPIPAAVIEATAAKYREAYERLTGQKL